VKVKPTSPSAEVENGGAIPPLLHTSSWCAAELVKHRDNFTFTVLAYFPHFEKKNAS
jgi:hypothetical protein